MKEETLQEFIKKINPTSDLFENFYNAVNEGDNKVLHNVISEAIAVDDKWIEMLENSIYYIENIVKDPKKFIKDEDIIVEVERARRTTSKTIRHLSQNSRDVSRIDPDGFVMPKKVLTTQIDEDLCIYENRFVCTLVTRLIAFVENQYNVINKKINYYDITNIGVDSNFALGRTVFNYKLALTVKEPPMDTIQVKKNDDLISRIEKLRNRLQIIKGTSFIKNLSNLKPVQPPIQKTNIIKMNINYSSCYKLWLYISAYTMLGYSVVVKDKNLPVDSDFFDDMTVLTATSIKSLIEDEKIRKFSYERLKFNEPRKKEYKIKTDIKYIPDFIKSKEEVSDEIVNEYYYTEMKKILMNFYNKKSSSSINLDKEIKLKFDKFYNSMAKVSDEIMINSIKEDIKTLPIRASVANRQKRFDEQKKYLKRLKQLSKLKSDNLEKSLKLESRELVKLEKLEQELFEAKKREYNIKAKKEKQKEKLEKIMAKSGEVKYNNEEYLAKIRDKEELRLKEIENKKQERKQELQRKRELTLLTHLKEKYEENNE